MRTTALVTGKKDEADLREPEIVSRFVSRLLAAMRQPEAPCSRRDLVCCRPAKRIVKLYGFTDSTRVAAGEHGRSRTRCSKTSERGRRIQRDHGLPVPTCHFAAVVLVEASSEKRFAALGTY